MSGSVVVDEVIGRWLSALSVCVCVKEKMCRKSKQTAAAAAAAKHTLY